MAVAKYFAQMRKHPGPPQALVITEDSRAALARHRVRVAEKKGRRAFSAKGSMRSGLSDQGGKTLWPGLYVAVSTRR
jgi:hypothetical protein